MTSLYERFFGEEKQEAPVVIKEAATVGPKRSTILVFIAIQLWMSQRDIESQHSSKGAQFLNMPPNMAWKSKQSRFHSNKDSFQDYTLAAVFSVLGLGLCSVLPFLGLISQSKSDSFTGNLTWILSRRDICSSCSFCRLRKIIFFLFAFLFPFLSSTPTWTQLGESSVLTLRFGLGAFILVLGVLFYVLLQAKGTQIIQQIWGHHGIMVHLQHGPLEHVMIHHFGVTIPPHQARSTW